MQIKLVTTFFAFYILCHTIALWVAKVFTFAWLLNASFFDSKGGIKRVKLCFKNKGITYSFKINTTETEERNSLEIKTVLT